MTPTYLKVFQAVGDYSAIARGAALDCRILLEAGWRVTVVAHTLDPELQKEVEWRPLTVPRRAFAYQWLAGRHFLLQARGNDAFDCVHAHQPQICDVCDVFQCHFLTRAIAACGGFQPWRGKRALTRIQEEIVLRAEDRFYRRLARLRGTQAPQVLFISHLLSEEFARLYGTPQNSEVLVKAPPPATMFTSDVRQRARQKWAPEAGNKLVIGFLGGTQKNKGFERVLAAMQGANELFLLFGGPKSVGFVAPQLRGHFKNVGFVEDTTDFYAACDVFVVASLFEPLGMVAFEAASCGVPVIATAGVGAWASLEEYGAGALWREGQNLEDLTRDLNARRSQVRQGATRLIEEKGVAAYGKRLVEVCEAAKSAKERPR